MAVPTTPTGVGRVRDLAVELLDGPVEFDTPLVEMVAAATGVDVDTVWELLCTSDDDDLVAAAARLDDCPVSQLRRLARHHQPMVRCMVAQHPRCPPDLLALLAYDRHAGVRANVAQHSATPARTLVMLTADAEWAVASNAVLNPSLPIEALVALTDSTAYADGPTRPALRTLATSQLVFRRSGDAF